IVTLFFSFYFDFHHSFFWPLAFFVLTLIFGWVGRYDWAKRLALSDWEVNRESEEKAIEFFHTLGTSKVSHKVTAMIMISTLEKRIQVLVDETLKTQITQNELDDMIMTMKKHFKQGNTGAGLMDSIQI